MSILTAESRIDEGVDLAAYLEVDMGAGSHACHAYVAYSLALRHVLAYTDSGLLHMRI